MPHSTIIVSSSSILVVSQSHTMNDIQDILAYPSIAQRVAAIADR